RTAASRSASVAIAAPTCSAAIPRTLPRWPFACRPSTATPACAPAGAPSSHTLPVGSPSPTMAWSASRRAPRRATAEWLPGPLARTSHGADGAAQPDAADAGHAADAVDAADAGHAAHAAHVAHAGDDRRA